MESKPRFASLTTKNEDLQVKIQEFDRKSTGLVLENDEIMRIKQDFNQIIIEKDNEIKEFKEQNLELLAEIKKKDAENEKLKSLLRKMKELEQDNQFLKNRIRILIQSNQNFKSGELAHGSLQRSDSAECYVKNEKSFSSVKTRENSNVSPAVRENFDLKKRIEALEKNTESILASPALQKNDSSFKERIWKRENEISKLIDSISPAKRFNMNGYNLGNKRTTEIIKF